MAQQRRIFEAGKQLPLEEWLTATKALLVDPFVKPIIRVSLLEMVKAQAVRPDVISLARQQKLRDRGQ